MVNKFRKVSFYRLSLEKQVADNGLKSKQIEQLDNQSIEESFRKLYDHKMTKLGNGNRAIRLPVLSGDYVVETISFEDRCAFIKIGQQNSSNTVALRDKTTLTTEDVPMSENQLLEVFTLCLIDFSTGIVSYLGINGVPRISVIQSLFNKSFEPEEKVETKLAAILTEDVLHELIKKQFVSKISVSIAVPEDKILSDMGLDLKSFDDIRNIKTKTVTYTLGGQRNKNIFSSKGVFSEFVEKMMGCVDRLKKFKVNARNEGENSQEYDLLHYRFTRTVVLGNEDTTQLTIEAFRKELMRIYDENKEELIRCCRS